MDSITKVVLMTVVILVNTVNNVYDLGQKRSTSFVSLVEITIRVR